jgi:hypothetical protein
MIYILLNFLENSLNSIILQWHNELTITWLVGSYNARIKSIGSSNRSGLILAPQELSKAFTSSPLGLAISARQPNPKLESDPNYSN